VVGGLFESRVRVKLFHGTKRWRGGGRGGKVREGEQKHVQDVECTVATASQFKNKDRKG